MNRFEVPLSFSEPIMRVHRSLTYEMRSVDDVSHCGSRGRQARFKGGYVARPLLDLSAFTCSAVVDCITFRAELGRTATGIYLNRMIKRGVGRSYYAELLQTFGGRPSSRAPSGRSFRLWIQDPTAPVLKKIIGVLRDQFGMVDDPVLMSIEVALDWYPNDASDELRHKMVAALLRHHFDPDFDGQDPLADVRQVFHRSSRPGETSLQYCLPGRQDQGRMTSDADSGQAATWSRLLRDRNPFEFFLDATVYRGRKDGGQLLRIQNKVTDVRNPQKKAVNSLSPKERRARIEIRVQGDDLRKLNLDRVEDLFSFNFAKLSRRFGTYFVTVKPPLKNMDAHPVQFSAFREGGVYGHVLRSRAARLKLKHDILSDPDADHLPRRGRVGCGKTDNLMAWAAMNKRHEDALRKLSKRWSQLQRVRRQRQRQVNAVAETCDHRIDVTRVADPSSSPRLRSRTCSRR